MVTSISSVESSTTTTTSSSSTSSTTVSPTTSLPLTASSWEDESDVSNDALEGFTTSVKSAVNKIVVTSMEISEEGEENDPTETNNDILEETTTKIDAEKIEEDESLTTVEPSTEPEASFKLDSTVIEHLDNNEISKEEEELSDNESEDRTVLEINAPEDVPKATKANVQKSTNFHTYIPGAEREILIAYLGNIDLSNVNLDSLKATPREKLAIVQELELQRLGLPPFTDPTPWQRLTRDQQLEFNRKYLALPSDVQSFSRNQFLTLPEKKQMRAYKSFLLLDVESLQRIIEDEMRRVKESKALLREKPRSQSKIKISKLNFNDLIDTSVEEKPEIKIVKPKKTTFIKKSKYDPRKRQFKSKQRQRKKTGQEQMTRAEKLHFEYARAQLQQAIKLQACLANPSACNL